MKSYTQNRKVIYTAVIGNYDNLSKPEFYNNDFDYICFTDNKNLKSPGIWQIKYIDHIKYINIDNVRLARYIKTNPEIFVGNYDYSIWVDANLIITGDMNDLINKCSSGYLGFKHTYRDCIYDEAIKCIEWSLDDINIINSEIDFLKLEKYPKHNGLIETNVLCRKHTQEIKKVNQAWWEMIKKYSRRDQLSHMYIIWKYKLNINIYPEAAWKTKYFRLKEHIGSRVFK